MGRLLSVNVGLPCDISWQGQTVHTGIWKAPVIGRRMVRRLNIDGDGQGDLAGHGGENRAVLVYQLDSYQYWQDQLGRTDLTYGQFGENFTVDGLPDAEVCIGDRYRIGSALFEVTQPRVTCYRAGIRMNQADMAALLVKHRRPGFYFRVLEEGHVEAGDEITLVAAGPERMSVSEIDALLYLPGHPRDNLERALRIPALSRGWRRSFEALLTQEREGAGATGNAGLSAASGPAPAWSGFRPFRVARKVRESSNVTSLMLEPADGQPVTGGLPGQFVVLRLGASSEHALMRSYSLSALPNNASYRISVKREPHGAAGTYIEEQLKTGDIVQASAARGNFTLRPGNTPVILLSAGIGVTPVLAMLHALAGETSTRKIWWLHGSRNGHEHTFAAEARELLASLPNRHSYICYSAPGPGDRPGVDFDAAGRLDMQALAKLGIPHDGDFYICGPSTFMGDLTTGLKNLSIASDRIHTELFGTAPSIAPGIAASPRKPPHLPTGDAGTGPMVSFARSGLNAPWDSSYKTLLEFAEACDVPVRWSCRAGVCHTCETGLVAGAVGYQPDPVDAPAEGNVLICCARPQGDIVIDL
ncbi:MOSC domain-containing protein YiiM [Bradyrhizobium sp. Rc2d]|uniref:MOSC and FAD-binding oxidoreductase domain-containing protein n=1 Tax=Bradyrhizobium sp. Rc2d TaxID=1855321 RepID=UPI0008889F99|nr:MOSC and FAD-binding oxidoreductase domain-containing protein [Bradyrhizobium sp. Rc2d]SDH89496.1 MOSC domain-containing protein YiiM [Bradyrhizobium sp. Rc2d]